jgi:two-component system NtrC family sensor kinase
VSAQRVLLLEPPPPAHDARGAVANALAALGADVAIEQCHDLDAARAVLAGGAVDLVVADERVGRMLELAEELRGRGAPPLLVITRSGDAFAVRAFRSGAADCVSGGTLARDLLPAARAQLGRARAERGAPSALDRAARNAVQHMNSALVVLDAAGRVSYANPVAEGLLGSAPGGLSGRPIGQLFPGVPPGRLLIQRTLAEGERLRGAEAVITREDGRAIPIGLSSAPLLGARGEREGAILLFQDLTETKQLERQFLQREKMASIGQLAAGVAHEINNPMGFIHANLSQLQEYLDDLARLWEGVEGLRAAVRAHSPELASAAAALDAVVAEVDADFLLRDLGKAVRESLEGSQRIRAIVQDLRSFSHRETGERVWADVNKALDSTANIVWTMMKHSVELSKHYAELPPILCFPMQLQQVFMNLLMNAYQAIEERAARDGAPGEIRLRTELADGGVRIAVSDNGIGMTAETQRRIFDPFFTTKQVGVGTGLGLSTSYQIVRRHGGRLNFQSERGVGTTFHVWLPLDDEEGG